MESWLRLMPEETLERPEASAPATVCIRDLALGPPFFVEGGLDLVSVCRQLAAQDLEWALVRDGERTGLFCTTDLREAILTGQAPDAVAVRDVASFDTVTLHPETTVVEALRLMERHGLNALPVRDGERLLGVLGRFEAAAMVADPARLLTMQIDKASSVEEMQSAAAGIDAMVARLYTDGTRIERIACLVGGLNSLLYARSWSMVAPQEVQRHSCLIMMGSEGRGEQVVKSDQDNALLLRDGHDFDDPAAAAERFNAALCRFGYPQCPGDLMLTNPQWRQSLGDFKQTLRRWMFGGDPNGVMNLAMFMDARAVAGDTSLLLQARRFVYDSVVDSDAFFARFARAAVQFHQPGTWWNRLIKPRAAEQAPVDLKKLGTFPVVHGVRALALQHHVEDLNTAQRVRALAQSGV
jgi:CBS domain-containing protein